VGSLLWVSAPDGWTSEVTRLSKFLQLSFLQSSKDLAMLKEARQYSIHSIQDEVRALVDKGFVGRKAQIYALSRYFGDREWKEVQRVLDLDNYLLRDSVCDLIGKESWMND
jgi:hypothetical protein